MFPRWCAWRWLAVVTTPICALHLSHLPGEHAHFRKDLCHCTVRLPEAGGNVRDGLREGTHDYSHGRRVERRTRSLRATHVRGGRELVLERVRQACGHSPNAAGAILANVLGRRCVHAGDTRLRSKGRRRRLRARLQELREFFLVPPFILLTRWSRVALLAKLGEARVTGPVVLVCDRACGRARGNAVVEELRGRGQADWRVGQERTARL
mmetsp:Transcript_3938/g.11640  ORF Transcript_3938/g.11640 Transcript_3938/m.11640 type:complete len:210 (+) Transcript_3938:96-725(+)